MQTSIGIEVGEFVKKDLPSEGVIKKSWKKVVQLPIASVDLKFSS